MNNQASIKAPEKERAFSSISIRSFVTVTALLIVLIAFAGILSLFVPQGSYSYTEEGAIIAGSYVKGEISGIAFWRVITAPFRVFVGSDSLNIIMISIFLLIMSGVFNVMEKTGGVKAVIKRAVTHFSDKKKLVICIAILFFMLFGSFFGMFEELVTLLPVMIVFMLTMGYDTMTGLGVCMLSACFGFSAAITNPFSVGLASQMAGTGVFDGVWLRIVFFAVIYLVLCFFMVRHTSKITKNPLLSPSYEVDRQKLANLDMDGDTPSNEPKLVKVYAVFFSVALVFLIAIASIRAIAGFAIPILAVVFLVGGLISGILVSDSKNKVFKWFLSGVVAMLPAVVMIALASSVKLVLDESKITATIMNVIIEFLSTKDKFVSVLLIYALILFLQIFIGSASAKIMLIMPLLVPVCEVLGISSGTLILTYCIADGFTDMILPTNPVLLIGLSMANVTYGKWLKWTYKLQLVILALTVLFLLFAVYVGL